MVVKIKWNDKCVRDGDQKITKKTTEHDEMESKNTNWIGLAREFIS